jgi:hypothetical protein
MRSLEFAGSTSFGLSAVVEVDIMKKLVRGTEKGRRGGKKRRGAEQVNCNPNATCAVFT